MEFPKGFAYGIAVHIIMIVGPFANSRSLQIQCINEMLQVEKTATNPYLFG